MFSLIPPPTWRQRHHLGKWANVMSSCCLFDDWGWQELVSLFFLLSDGTPEKRPFVSVQTVVAGGSKPPLEES